MILSNGVAGLRRHEGQFRDDVGGEGRAAEETAQIAQADSGTTLAHLQYIDWKIDVQVYLTENRDYADRFTTAADLYPENYVVLRNSKNLVLF